MFIKRLGSAIVLLAITGCSLYLGGYLLLLLCAVASVLGTFELLKLENMQKTIPGFFSYFSVVCLYIIIAIAGRYLVDIWLIASVMLILISYVFGYPQYNIKQICICILPLVYVALFLVYALLTRNFAYGHWFVWLIIIVASGSDTCAYAAGMLLGKHHFSELSPKKTIEGCLGGVVGSALLALAYSFFLPQEACQMLGANVHWIFVGIGFAGSFISQIGDLVASAIKRNYNIKDYSNLIPGHGGVLDRIDSILFVTPIVYFTLFYFFVV